MSALAAVRTELRNGKHSIEITLPDGTTTNAGGARATRAAAVIVSQHEEGRPYTIELRSDADAAFQQANRRRGHYTMKHAGHVFNCHSTFSEAVLVTEASS